MTASRASSLLFRRISSSYGTRLSLRNGYGLSNATSNRFASSHGSEHGHGSGGSSHSTLHPPHSLADRYWLLASIIVFGPAFWYLTTPGHTVKTVAHDVEDNVEHLADEVKEHSPPIAPASSAKASITSSSTALTEPAAYQTPAAAETPQVPSEPPTVKYVLVGGGTAASSAAEAIKEKEPEADVLLITEEEFAPYMRPPLSKELWFEADASALKFKDWNGKDRSLFYQPDKYYVQVDKSLASLHLPSTEPKKVRLLTETKVSSIDPEQHYVVLDNGKKVKYSKILIATGGTPRNLDIFDSMPPTARKHIHTYRSLKDFKFLEGVCKSEKSIVVIGGGFLGSELAVALAQKKKNGVKVTQIFPEEGNMALVFPRYLTKWTSHRLEKEGVVVKPSSTITSVKSTNDDKITITLKSGEQVVADEVVIAVGIQPNTDLAEKSGLETDDKRGGIVVNAELENRGDVFAAGDVTSYHDIALGRRRVEHHDHAVMSGRTAGENMVGKKKPYTHLSMFWSDLGPEIGYEAVGVIDSSLSTVGVWAKGNDHVPRPPAPGEAPPSKAVKPAADSGSIPPVDAKPDDEYGKGVVFYLSPEKRIMGVLMWNVFGKVPLARQIIKEKKTFAEINEIAGLFNVHDSA